MYSDWKDQVVQKKVTEERLKLYLTHAEIRMLIEAGTWADRVQNRRRGADLVDYAFDGRGASDLETLVMRLAREDSDVYQEHPAD